MKTASKQQVVIDALKIVSGFEDWRFKQGSRGTVIVMSCHDIEYELATDGALTALPLEKCDKCHDTGLVQKKGSFSAKSCDCVLGRRKSEVAARDQGFIK
jgi:hypothetical protein